MFENQFIGTNEEVHWSHHEPDRLHQIVNKIAGSGGASSETRIHEQIYNKYDQN